MLTEMHDEFLVLIEGVNDLKEMQKHAETKYYPEFVGKLSLWFAGLSDEVMVRDMLRNEVINDYSKRFDLSECVRDMASAKAREDQGLKNGRETISRIKE